MNKFYLLSSTPTILLINDSGKFLLSICSIEVEISKDVYCRYLNFFNTSKFNRKCDNDSKLIDEIISSINNKDTINLISTIFEIISIIMINVKNGDKEICIKNLQKFYFKLKSLIAIIFNKNKLNSEDLNNIQLIFSKLRNILNLSKKEEKILYCINSNSIENIAYITIVNENYWEKNKCISEYPPKWVEKGYFIPNKFLYLGNSTWKIVLGDKFKNTEEIKKFLEFNPKMIYSKELENFINKN